MDKQQGWVECALHVKSTEGWDQLDTLHFTFNNPTFTEEGQRVYGVTTADSMSFNFEDGIVELYFEGDEHPISFEMRELTIVKSASQPKETTK